MALLEGEPLTAEFRERLPSIVRVEMNSSKTELCHLMFHSGQPILICHERMVAKLEELEPGLHETFPVTINIKNSGEVIEGEYFLTHVTEKVACFDEDRIVWSTLLDHKVGVAAAQDAHYRPLTPSEIFLKEAEVAGRHLWRGAPMVGARQLFCSDELAEFVRAEGLRGWCLLACHLT